MRLNLRKSSGITALITCVAGGFLAAATPNAAAAPSPRLSLGHPAAHPVGRSAAATAAPVGRLGTGSCTMGTGSAACDLYAMTGSTSINGTSVPIWGFSTTGAAGSATAPGPVLVVRQHDSVTITLHNQLAEPVSLALPGQAAVTAAGATGDDVTGAAGGATRTYTFSADRAGTFLYEAGHTSDGTRQVAMGLAGALVVLPGDNTAYGTAATAYDDEAVLVLSEIDPRLNADPAHFDMRNFRPAYRTINGKAFPGTDVIATDQGHTVLLRYVNAGAETHPMGVLGTSQLEIAQDGHRATYPTRVTAESVDPGATLDTLVTMPGGPEAKFAVYDASQHLDNNGQTGPGPLQVAFGGMLTFLDTNAPQPSTDGVGPVPAHVSATPNPSDALSPVTVSADLSDQTTGNSPIDQAEFVVDDATTIAPGFGIPMTGTFGGVTVTGATGTLPVTGTCATATTVALSCLPAGKHRIYVRGHDTAGNWGVIGSVVFNLPKTGPATTNGSVDSPTNGAVDIDLSATGDDSDAGGTIVAAEYFVDTAGGNGSGIAMTTNRVATVVSEDATITAATVAALPEGTHHLLVHSKDSLGLWGPTLDVPLVVDKTGPTVDAVAVGPNPSNGLVSDPSNPGYAVVSGQLTDKDAGGAAQSPLVAAESFLRTVGTPGSGLQLLAVDGAFDSSQEKVYGLIPLSQIKALASGEYNVYLHGKDAAGNWGSVLAAKLVVDKVAPVLSALSVSPNPTNGAATVTATATMVETGLLQAAEYWFGTTDPGVGKATATQPSTPTPGQVQLTIPTAGLAAGSQTLNVRVKDQAGNWSVKVSATFTVVRPNLISATNFEPGDPAWGVATGNVGNVTAAKLPTTAWEPASTQGMQATLPTVGTTRNAYRTDNTPALESTYHARFAFSRNTLNSGTTVGTLFRAQTNTGQAFALQYQAVGATGQVRLVLNGTTGTTNGTWVALGAGTNRIQLDWTTGSNGSLKLTLNGAAAQTLTRANAGYTVESIQLGLIGFGSGNTGTAYFDSFSSGRTSA